MLAAARRPRLIDEEGGLSLIRADVRARQAFGAIAADVAAASVTLTLTRGGRIERIRTSVSGPDGALVADFGLGPWTAPAIAAPAPGDIDTTPDVNEEAILAYADAPLLQPRGLPDGWRLLFADVLDADVTTEHCQQIELDYGPPLSVDTDEETPYLSLFELPASCPGLEGSLRGDKPFRAGRAVGFVRRDPESGSLLAQFRSGNTIVQADTNLDEADLSRILAELVPLDFERTYEQIGGVSGPKGSA